MDQGQLHLLYLFLHLVVVEIVDVDIQRTELALVFLVDWNRSNTLLAIYVALNKFFCQRIADNHTFGFCFAVTPDATHCGRAMCSLCTDEYCKQSLCLCHVLLPSEVNWEWLTVNYLPLPRLLRTGCRHPVGQKEKVGQPPLKQLSLRPQRHCRGRLWLRA